MCGRWLGVAQMDRSEFHRYFKTIGPAVLPVVHVLNEDQAIRNIRLAMQEGAQGVFLINHDFSCLELLPILRRVREKLPFLWMGVNFLGINAKRAFKLLGELSTTGCQIDAYWADNACIDERVTLDEQKEANEIQKAREESGWKGLYFGGTAFKFQRQVSEDQFGKTAKIASHYMDVVTTSGAGTSIAAGIQKITDMRTGIGDRTLGLASGVTPDNAANYTPYFDCFLVATGVSRPNDFYNFDPLRMRALVHIARGTPLTPSITTIYE